MTCKHVWRNFVSSRIRFIHLIKTATRTFHENPTFETVKSEVINSLFETVRLSVSISPGNLYNSLKVSKKKALIYQQQFRLQLNG